METKTKIVSRVREGCSEDVGMMVAEEQNRGTLVYYVVGNADVLAAIEMNAEMLEMDAGDEGWRWMLEMNAKGELRG